MSESSHTSDQPSIPCAYHPDAPAIAYCADCGSDVCGACHASDERGYALCPVCRRETPEYVPAWERADSAYTPRAYVAAIWGVIRHPRSFFQTLPERGRWGPAVAFGYVATLFGLLANRLWMLALESGSTAISSDFGVVESLTAAESLTLYLASTPIHAALALGVHIGVLGAAVSFAGADFTWKQVARIGGYALGSYVFLVVPPLAGFPLGHFLAVLWLFNLESSALRVYADFGPWSATATVALPALAMTVCGG